jgi:hypothetical protein
MPAQVAYGPDSNPFEVPQRPSDFPGSNGRPAFSPGAELVVDLYDTAGGFIATAVLLTSKAAVKRMLDRAWEGFYAGYAQHPDQSLAFTVKGFAPEALGQSQHPVLQIEPANWVSDQPADARVVAELENHRAQRIREGIKLPAAAGAAAPQLVASQPAPGLMPAPAPGGIPAPQAVYPPQAQPAPAAAPQAAPQAPAAPQAQPAPQTPAAPQAAYPPPATPQG